MGLYRAILWVLPSSFRAEYGDEMCAIFAARRARTSGALAVAALWLGVVADLLVNACRVHVDLLRQDLRHAARSLARSPGFAVAAILVAALGIGATTAAFSITDHVLFRPLPFFQADRLVKLWEDPTPRGRSRRDVSPANYRDWRRMSTAFDAMAPYSLRAMNLVGGGVPSRLDGAAVGAQLLSLLGARPALGRAFSEDDDREGAPGTVLISHRLWQDAFGGAPSAVGRTVRLDEQPYLVVGVMPADFFFPTRETQFWTPTRFGSDDFRDRTNRYFQVIARLKPGVTRDQARANLDVVSAELARVYPDANQGLGVTVIGVRDELSAQTRLLMLSLLGASACLLLLATTNLASLLVTRASARQRELAVRTALGAGRDRLVRQMLTESLVLAGIGGVLGVLLAISAAPLLAQLAPNALPIAGAPTVDLRALAVAALATIVTGVAFGILPALRAGRAPDMSGLRDGARAGTGRATERLRSSLVVIQVGISVVLLVSSGLLIRALWQLEATDPGFRTDNVLTMRTALPLPKYGPTARRVAFYERVTSEVKALPGVTDAAYISFLPMVSRGGIWNVTIAGRAEDPQNPRMASLRYLTPGFFRAMNIPIRQGRDVAAADTQESPRVAVVSESFTREHWPGEPALGRRFTFAFQERAIVGVVGDVRVRGLERSSEPQVYLPATQVPDGSIIGYTPKDLVVKASVPTAGLMAAIRQIIAAADPDQPISSVRPLRDIVEGETAPRSVQVRVLGGFAAIACVLAGLGLHGLLAYGVSIRTREIGVRLALGARRSDVLWLVVGRGLVLAGAGVVAGGALAYAAGRSLQAALAGVAPADTATFVTAAAIALVMAAAGSLLPALRALRIAPIEAMRSD